ncbi:MAG: hypothetical protein ACQGQO_01060 [Sphaerochaetaceae bacterium]
MAIWVCPKCGAREKAPVSKGRVCEDCGTKMRVITEKGKALKRLDDRRK